MDLRNNSDVTVHASRHFNKSLHPTTEKRNTERDTKVFRFRLLAAAERFDHPARQTSLPRTGRRFWSPRWRRSPSCQSIPRTKKTQEPRDVAMIKFPHREIGIICWSMFEVDTDANVARKNIGNRWILAVDLNREIETQETQQSQWHHDTDRSVQEVQHPTYLL